MLGVIFGSGYGSVLTHHLGRIDDAITADITKGFNKVPGQTIRGRTFSVSTDYVLGWDRGIRVFRDNPIFGVGLGNSIFFMDIYDRLFTPFSLHILLLAEMGIVGYGTFWLMIGVLLFPLVAALWKIKAFATEYRAVAIPMMSGFGGSLVTYQIHGGARFDTTDWLVMGILIAVGRIALSHQRDGEWAS